MRLPCTQPFLPHTIYGYVAGIFQCFQIIEWLNPKISFSSLYDALLLNYWELSSWSIMKDNMEPGRETRAGRRYYVMFGCSCLVFVYFADYSQSSQSATALPQPNRLPVAFIQWNRVYLVSKEFSFKKVYPNHVLHCVCPEGRERKHWIVRRDSVILLIIFFPLTFSEGNWVLKEN